MSRQCLFLVVRQAQDVHLATMTVNGIPCLCQGSRNLEMHAVSGSDGDEDGDGQDQKRPKPDPQRFAWAGISDVLEVALRSELRQTLAFLREYEKDIRFSRRHLLNTVGVPEFPTAEWDNILRGSTVDLDHVLSGQYALGTQDKQAQKIGDLKISYRALKPKRRVTSLGDWVIAWGKTSAATCFAFPHRETELRSYQVHIVSLFGALAVSQQSRVIDYDRAVRKRVGTVQDVLLTDFASFNDLKIMCIDSVGAGTVTGRSDTARPSPRSSPSKQGPKRDEVCKRWNNGQCRHTAKECRYKHVCARCGRSGHPESRCAQGAQ